MRKNKSKKRSREEAKINSPQNSRKKEKEPFSGNLTLEPHLTQGLNDEDKDQIDSLIYERRID